MIRLCTYLSLSLSPSLALCSCPRHRMRAMMPAEREIDGPDSADGYICGNNAATRPQQSYRVQTREAARMFSFRDAGFQLRFLNIVVSCKSRLTCVMRTLKEVTDIFIQ